MNARPVLLALGVLASWAFVACGPIEILFPKDPDWFSYEEPRAKRSHNDVLNLVLAEYGRNPVRAEGKYVGQRAELTGKITGMRQESYPFNYPEFDMDLGTGNDFRIPFSHSNMNKTMYDAGGTYDWISQFNKGDTVLVRCEIGSLDTSFIRHPAGTPQFTECQLPPNYSKLLLPPVTLDTAKLDQIIIAHELDPQRAEDQYVGMRVKLNGNIVYTSGRRDIDGPKFRIDTGFRHDFVIVLDHPNMVGQWEDKREWLSQFEKGDTIEAICEIERLAQSQVHWPVGTPIFTNCELTDHNPRAQRRSGS